MSARQSGKLDQAEGKQQVCLQYNCKPSQCVTCHSLKAAEERWHCIAGALPDLASAPLKKKSFNQIVMCSHVFVPHLPPTILPKTETETVSIANPHLAPQAPSPLKR